MKIAIVGYGVEGRSNYAYYRMKEPTAEITIFDERDSLDNLPDGTVSLPLTGRADEQSSSGEVKPDQGRTFAVLGQGAFDKITGYDLVLRSPGIAPRRIKQSENHWSATREFMRQCPATIIGVTGSKGKGTTCSFTAAILKRYLATDEHHPNRQVHLVGNIGVPVLDILPKIQPDDLVVYEMSSFQLWDCTKSPHIAIVTMIEPDHLNVHRDFAEYVQAKLNILEYQQDGDVAIFNNTNPEIAELIHHIVVTTRAEAVPYPTGDGPHFDEQNFYMGQDVVCPVSAVKLPGQHNLLNACAAIAATWEIVGKDGELIAEGLSDFAGLPHRLKFVREVNGTKFYDDSIATTPGSAIAAVKAFSEPKVLILGGSDKGADYHELGRVIDGGNVRTVLVIGANGDKIQEQIQAETDTPVVRLKTNRETKMSEIVQTAYDLANPGDVVIMSPAAASFDMFKSYVDRGQQFIKAVNMI